MELTAPIPLVLAATHVGRRPWTMRSPAPAEPELSEQVITETGI
jgi:hypothetical protein